MIRTSVCVLLACALTACGGDDTEDIKAWMKQESAGMRGKVPPLPQIQIFPVVSYEAGAIVDPFRAERLDPTKKSGAVRPDLDRRREPLEAFPLESLAMVGMLQTGGRPVALIRADKAIYQVKVGQYMGQNFGVVTQISEGEVTLKELVEDANGDWVERVSSMQLQEREIKK